MSDLYEWKIGYTSGVDAVMEFLKQVKNINFKEEFEAWSNCDSFTNWKGERIGSCGEILG